MPKYELEDLRVSLNNIDSALVCMLAERFHVTSKISQVKSELGLPPVDKIRELELFQRIEQQAEHGGLDPGFAKRIFRIIVDEVVEHHRRHS